MKVALLGANGFLGIRATERWYRGSQLQPVPIVRSFASMARLSKFDLEIRLADALDEKAMAQAFQGCEVVVHAVAGTAETVAGSAAPAYRAANAAGARRLVYISSASVHGQAPAAGTDESSPLDDHQWSWYNNAKIHAEKELRRARNAGKTEIVILRPGIVWGPRSRWVTDFVEGLMSGRANVVNEGEGVLNSIFVDNLVYAIELASTRDGVDRQPFLVQDDEEVRWVDLYRPLCAAMGRPWEEVLNLEPPPLESVSRIESMRGSKFIQTLLPFFPRRVKRIGKAAIQAWPKPAEATPFSLPAKPTPKVSREMAELHQCAWRFPDHRAREILGYRAERSFDEGVAITLRWLALAGYPLKESQIG